MFSNLSPDSKRAPTPRLSSADDSRSKAHKQIVEKFESSVSVLYRLVIGEETKAPVSKQMADITAKLKTGVPRDLTIHLKNELKNLKEVSEYNPLVSRSDLMAAKNLIENLNDAIASAHLPETVVHPKKTKMEKGIESVFGPKKSVKQVSVDPDGPARRRVLKTLGLGAAGVITWMTHEVTASPDLFSPAEGLNYYKSYYGENSSQYQSALKDFNYYQNSSKTESDLRYVWEAGGRKDPKAYDNFAKVRDQRIAAYNHLVKDSAAEIRERNYVEKKAYQGLKSLAKLPVLDGMSKALGGLETVTGALSNAVGFGSMAGMVYGAYQTSSSLNQASQQRVLSKTLNVHRHWLQADFISSLKSRELKGVDSKQLDSGLSKLEAQHKPATKKQAEAITEAMQKDKTYSHVKFDGLHLRLSTSVTVRKLESLLNQNKSVWKHMAAPYCVKHQENNFIAQTLENIRLHKPLSELQRAFVQDVLSLAKTGQWSFDSSHLSKLSPQGVSAVRANLHSRGTNLEKVVSDEKQIVQDRLAETGQERLTESHKAFLNTLAVDGLGRLVLNSTHKGIHDQFVKAAKTHGRDCYDVTESEKTALQALGKQLNVSVTTEQGVTQIGFTPDFLASKMVSETKSDKSNAYVQYLDLAENNFIISPQKAAELKKHCPTLLKSLNELGSAPLVYNSESKEPHQQLIGEFKKAMAGEYLDNLGTDKYSFTIAANGQVKLRMSAKDFEALPQPVQNYFNKNGLWITDLQSILIQALTNLVTEDKGSVDFKVNDRLFTVTPSDGHFLAESKPVSMGLELSKEFKNLCKQFGISVRYTNKNGQRITLGSHMSKKGRLQRLGDWLDSTTLGKLYSSGSKIARQHMGARTRSVVSSGLKTAAMAAVGGATMGVGAAMGVGLYATKQGVDFAKKVATDNKSFSTEHLSEQRDFMQDLWQLNQSGIDQAKAEAFDNHGNLDNITFHTDD